MESAHEVIAKIDSLFHSRSIAIVGVPRGMKTGKVFLLALLDQGFDGRIYPVNPRAQEIDGLKTYSRVADIPGPVDLAIIVVPNKNALAAVQQCAAKGVKGAVLFTAGFSETGTSQGADLEAELVRTARAAGMRLIGPNGMGLYCPETGLSFFPQASRQSGPVGMISHSGSLTNILSVIGEQKGIRFSKVISSGNECDLTAADFIAFLAHDPATDVIGAYIEGIKNGPHFLQALGQASLKKPVIIWKVGLTSAGARAASSHTGALASAPGIWQGVLQQSGAIPVVGFEAIVDALMGFAMFPKRLGNRIAILSGPGGLAVSAAEACGRQGLELAEILPETSAALARFIPFSGTSLHNPIDVSLAAHFDLEIFFQSARTLAKDPGVDAVIVIGCGLTPETNQEYAAGMIQVLQEYKKPILAVKIPGFDPQYGPLLCRGGVPFFDSAERAVGTYALAWRYQSWLRRQNGSDK
ncbi:MAG: CoA-binding protein [Desulfobacterales bacterium]|nr:MAG: CoA-binding protein [Desulfobacterales bacterium]